MVVVQTPCRYYTAVTWYKLRRAYLPKYPSHSGIIKRTDVIGSSLLDFIYVSVQIIVSLTRQLKAKATIAEQSRTRKESSDYASPSNPGACLSRNQSKASPVLYIPVRTN
jgi:hypothetical protein